ncbi:MAG: hypothetical protein JWO48_2728, partial [Bryobacterales bacterium]|nr:hypothetical protein [Bryobacterales bacterium]
MLAGTFGRDLPWLHQTIGHILFFVALTATGWKLWRQRLPLRVYLLNPTVNILIGAFLAGKAWRGIVAETWNTREDLAMALSIFILFYLTLTLVEEGLLSSASVLAAAVSIAAAITLGHLERHRSASLPLDNPAVIAGLLILVTPLAVGGFRGAAGGLRKVVWLVAILILSAEVLQTRSAMAIVTLPALLLTSALIGKNRGWRGPLAISAAVAAVCLVLWFGNRFNFVAPNSLTQQGIDVTGDVNKTMQSWSGAVLAIRERPVSGWGAGEIGLAYPPFRVQQPGADSTGAIVADLHSLPLQWAFEYGIVGSVLRAAAFGVFLVAGYSRRTILQKTAVVALAGFAAFCLFHSNLDNPATKLIATLVAVVAAPRLYHTNLNVRESKRTGLLLICCAVAVLCFQLRLDYAGYLLANSNRQEAHQAVQSVIRASLLDPRGGFYDFVAAHKIDQMLKDDARDRSSQLQLADYHYQKALARNPWSPQVLATYGNFLLGTGACGAVATLEKAVSLDFYFSLSHFDLANAYLSCGPRQQAVEEAAVAILTTPATAYASRWRGDSEFLAAALDQSLRWLEGWDSKGCTAIDREQLRRLADFVRRARTTPVPPSHTMVILSDTFTDQPGSDPFAYIFQRRTPA